MFSQVTHTLMPHSRNSSSKLYRFLSSLSCCTTMYGLWLMCAQLQHCRPGPWQSNTHTSQGVQRFSPGARNQTRQEFALSILPSPAALPLRNQTNHTSSCNSTVGSFPANPDITNLDSLIIPPQHHLFFNVQVQAVHAPGFLGHGLHALRSALLASRRFVFRKSTPSPDAGVPAPQGSGPRDPPNPVVIPVPPEKSYHPFTLACSKQIKGTFASGWVFVEDVSSTFLTMMNMEVGTLFEGRKFRF